MKRRAACVLLIVVLIWSVSRVFAAEHDSATALNVRVLSWYAHHRINWQGRWTAQITGLLKNEGDQPVRDIRVTAKEYWGPLLIYDGDRFDVYIDWLAPGETTPIFSYNDEIPFGSEITSIVWILSGAETSVYPRHPVLEIGEGASHPYDNPEYTTHYAEVVNRDNCNVNSIKNFWVPVDEQGNVAGVLSMSPYFTQDSWVLPPSFRYPFTYNTGRDYDMLFYPVADFTDDAPWWLEVVTKTYTLDDGDLRFSTTLYNPEPLEARGLMIVSTLRSADGTLVGELRYSASGTIPPMGTRTFQTTHYRSDNAPEWTIWELQAQALGDHKPGTPCVPNTATPQLTATPTLTLTPTPTATSISTHTPTATGTSTPTPTPTATRTSTPTYTPTLTVTPSPTPELKPWAFLPLLMKRFD